MLAALFTLIGLNLAGVFEFGRCRPPVGGTCRRHPVVDLFLTGVLAVAVASPCTAPFMGAFAGPGRHAAAAQALAVFARSVWAWPYLAASLWPGGGAGCRGRARGWRASRC